MEFTSELSFSFHASAAVLVAFMAGLALGQRLPTIAKARMHGITERRPARRGGRRRQASKLSATVAEQDALAISRPRRRRPQRRDVLHRVRGSSALCLAHPRRGTVKAEQDGPFGLKEWRDRRGWTLKRLGAEVGLSPGQVGKLERGDEDLSLSRLRQLAWALDCRPVDLLPRDLQSPGGQAA